MHKLLPIIFSYIHTTLENVKSKSSTPQYDVQPKIYARYDSLIP